MLARPSPLLTISARFLFTFKPNLISPDTAIYTSLVFTLTLTIFTSLLIILLPVTKVAVVLSNPGVIVVLSGPYTLLSSMVLFDSGLTKIVSFSLPGRNGCVFCVSTLALASLSVSR
jgi:hypothetical protein